MYSKLSNCSLADDDGNPFSNILSVSSKRSTADKIDPTDCLNVTEDQIEEFYDKLAEIDVPDDDEVDNDELKDFNIAHIANFIENKIRSSKQFSCSSCKRIFEENMKVAENVNFRSEKPCQSTFSICKQTDRFLKVEMLKGTINFKVIYHEILQILDFEVLYEDTDFSTHYDHKIFLVRYVVNEFIRIKGTHLAKTATMNEHKQSLRIKFHKLLHYLGQ